MEDNFKKYNSIENHYQEGFINKIREASVGLPISWFVTEKIHGCNAQISYDGKEVKYGKRTSYIENENFYNIKEVLGQYKDKLIMYYNHLATFGLELDKVIFFGELFGGSYPHPDVPRNKKCSPIQKGVYYTPNHEFKLFDICITFKDGEYRYLSGYDFIKICEIFGLPHVPVLDVNIDLEKALAFKNDGESKVYSEYGLPQIQDNIMEGIVIRGWDTDLWLPNKQTEGLLQSGVVLSKGSRAIIKSKNDRFKEVSHQKKKVVEHKDVPEHIQNILNDLNLYVTPQRVENVISHFGEISLSQFGEILKAVNLDVLEDFEKDSNVLNTLEKNELNFVRKQLSAQVAKVTKLVIYSKV